MADHEGVLLLLEDVMNKGSKSKTADYTPFYFAKKAKIRQGFRGDCDLFNKVKTVDFMAEEHKLLKSTKGGENI